MPENKIVELAGYVREEDGLWFPFGTGRTAPTWTPDGRQIIIASYDDAGNPGAPQSNLYLLTLP